MLKLFESAASGCATFCDWTPDLDYLGFVDGENIIVFRDFDELVEKARYYLAQPDELRRIGSNGAALALERHTWKHRAIELRQVLQNAI
jgi:spore maturation protein CgeB